MWDRAFANRLRKELPGWVEDGLLTPGAADAVLTRAEARAAHGVGVIPVALAVIGALTLGAGVILFFAANWDEMSKPAKLAVLFGSMWGAYAIAGRGLSGSARASRVLAHAMLLLGVLLFGANIQLIAQIYHIDAHYPNGVLMWSLGALVLVWVVPSEPVAVAGLALATLWSGMEIGDFDRHLHWPFLAVWALFAAPALYRRWQWGTCAALLALGVWCFMTFAEWPSLRSGDALYLLQIFAPMWAAIHLAGIALQEAPRLSALSTVIRRTSLIGALVAAHGFVYAGLHGLHWYSWNRGTVDAASWTRDAPGIGIVIFSLAFTLAAFGLAAALYRQAASKESTRDLAGIALAAIAAVLLIANLFLPGRYGSAVLMYIAINGTVFASLIWMVVHGYRSGERFQVYSAFVAYAAGMLAVYFMDFFSLMSRSLIVMGGGAVLVVGVYVMERQRRRVGPPEGASTP